MPELVTRLVAGSPVPEWLLSVEPLGEHSYNRAFHFMVEVDIIDLPDCYLVQPRAVGVSGPHVISGEIGFCRIAAASKPVYIAKQYDVILPAEVDAAALRAQQALDRANDPLQWQTPLPQSFGGGRQPTRDEAEMHEHARQRALADEMQRAYRMAATLNAQQAGTQVQNPRGKGFWARLRYVVTGR